MKKPVYLWASLLARVAVDFLCVAQEFRVFAGYGNGTEISH